MAKHVFEKFTLREISAVTNPAQTGAKMTIMKAAVSKIDDVALTELVLKRGQTDSGAQTFAEILQVKAEQEKAWKVRSELYPIFDAINDSVSSILGDTSLTMAQKTLKVNTSVKDFLAAIKAKFPDVEEEIAKALTAAGLPGLKEGNPTMTKDEQDKLDAAVKKAADAEAALATATALAELTDDQKTFYAKLDKDGKTEFLKLPAADRVTKVAKAREGDESFESDGVTIRKSEVGSAVFAMLKGQKLRIDAAEVAMKASNVTAENAVFKARATTELADFPGTDDDKIAILKAVSKDPVADKALSVILKASGKAFTRLFEEFGRSDDDIPVRKSDENSAEAEINKLAKEVRKADPKLSEDQAVAKVLSENPELYARFDEERTVSIDDPGTDD